MNKSHSQPCRVRSLAAVLLTFFLVGASGCAGEPFGYDTPESVVHDTRDDVYLVSNIHAAPLAKDNNGYISRVRIDSPGMNRRWIAGGQNGVTLHAPKGLAIHGDVLWVTDIDVVRKFDRGSGAPLGEIAIPGATFLNDCAVAPDGTVYCSDSGLDASFASTGTDAIWRIGADAVPSVLIRGPELGQPNGLVAQPIGVYVVSWRDGTFYQVDTAGRRTDLGKAPAAKLDGLVRVTAADGSGGAFYATSWEGQCVYRFSMQGGVETLPMRLEQPADCCFDQARRRLVVPLFGQNKVESFPIDGR